MKLYIRGTTNYLPQDREKADKVRLSELVQRLDHEDGSVTIVELQRAPVQPGQYEWLPK